MESWDSPLLPPGSSAARLTRTTVILEKPSSNLSGRSLPAHALHHVLGHYPIAALIAFHPHFRGHVERDRLHLVAEIVGHLEPACAPPGAPAAGNAEWRKPDPGSAAR